MSVPEPVASPGADAGVGPATGPVVRWAAPGRVNLIGEHTDYNDGFVLPIALPFHTVATVGAGRSGWLRLRSAQRPDDVVELPLSGLRPGEVDGWAGYVAGVVWALREAGQAGAGGLEIAVDGQVPEGAGLSSSAALECSVAAALNDLLRLGLTRAELARLARRAENDFVGAPTGAMDQMAAMLCRAGHALFLDSRSLHAEQVPLDLGAAGLALLVVDTHTAHRLVTGEYGARRRSCEEAAAVLGVPALRDISSDELDAALARLADEVQRRRTRHVVTENARVLSTVALLRGGRLPEIGPLLTASHRSLRDDFEVTVPELDVAVDAALAAGALGARMTGGGFGGCVLALLAAGDGAEQAVRSAVDAAYLERGFTAPGFVRVAPSAGAHRLD